MRLLVIRTSAMGDVALTTLVLRGIREKYPDTELTLVTMKAFSPFFHSINGLELFFPDFKIRHKGIAGLFRLFTDIRKSGTFDYVIDLHDVLRTKILRSLFRLTGIPVSVIDKGRSEKRALINGRKKIQLKHTVQRYQEVFAKAGFDAKPPEGPWIVPPREAVTRALEISGITAGLNIGVAPYTKHELKMWPEESMVTLLRMISKSYAKFWLFGGPEESDLLESFQKKIPGSVNLAGKLNLEEELAVMTKLSFMIAMDSSNMHMAALVGTNVISIWGATDPLMGFAAWMQPKDHFISISIEELTCRPCTVYGKGECWRGDHACMEWLTPKMVYDKIRATGLLEVKLAPKSPEGDL